MNVYNSTNLYLINLLTLVAPRWVFRLLAGATGVIAYGIGGRVRRAIRANLRTVTGRRDVEWLVITTLCKFSLNWCDIMLTMRLTGPRLHALIGRHASARPMDEALAAGTGAILISPHLGNWELGGLGLADLGYPINVLTFREPDEKVNAMRERLRRERGIRFIYVDRDDTSPLAIIEAVNALRRNEVLAILGDRDGSSHTIRLPFFGRPTNLPVGAAYLALASGAPVIPVFVPLERGKYMAIMEEPIRFTGGHGAHSAAIRSGMERLVEVFEAYIRRYPDQWYNFFDFWGEQQPETEMELVHGTQLTQER